MASKAKIEANRRNATKSTGPKTTAGKRTVSKNAIRHGLQSQEGLLLGESPFEFHFLELKLERELQPEGEIEAMMVRSIVSLAWRLERARRMEAGLHIWNKFESMGTPTFDRIFLEIQRSLACQFDPLIEKAPEEHRDAVRSRVIDIANGCLTRGVSAAAWATPGTELIECYEARIERRLRRLLKELEARQLARLRGPERRRTRKASSLRPAA